MAKLDPTQPVTMSDILDRAVRLSRENGWCAQFEQAMDLIFGLTGSDLVDDHGVTCRGYLILDGADHYGGYGWVYVGEDYTEDSLEAARHRADDVEDEDEDEDEDSEELEESEV